MLLCGLKSLNKLLNNFVLKRNKMNRPQVGVGIFVINSEGNKILIGKRQNENKWGLPGGKLEYTETFESCAKRELQKETCINIKDLDRFRFMCSFNAVDKNIGYHWAEINHLLKLTKEEEEILSKEDNKIKNWQWFSYEELSKLYSDLFLSLQIFITKYKIDSFEKILNLKAS